MEIERHCPGHAVTGFFHPQRAGDGEHLELKLSPSPAAVVTARELLKYTVILR
jgi:hypothetical protein